MGRGESELSPSIIRGREKTYQSGRLTSKPNRKNAAISIESSEAWTKKKRKSTKAVPEGGRSREERVSTVLIEQRA